MDFLYFMLGAGVGYLIRPAMCFYANYEWFRKMRKYTVARSLKMSLKDIWS